MTFPARLKREHPSLNPFSRREFPNERAAKVERFCGMPALILRDGCSIAKWLSWRFLVYALVAITATGSLAAGAGIYSLFAHQPKFHDPLWTIQPQPVPVDDTSLPTIIEKEPAKAPDDVPVVASSPYSSRFAAAVTTLSAAVSFPPPSSRYPPTQADPTSQKTANISQTAPVLQTEPVLSAVTGPVDEPAPSRVTTVPFLQTIPLPRPRPPKVAVSGGTRSASGAEHSEPDPALYQEFLRWQQSQGRAGQASKPTR
jgi:hypothetical protein